MLCIWAHLPHSDLTSSYLAALSRSDQVQVRLPCPPPGNFGCFELIQLQIENVLRQEQLLAVANKNVILASVHLVGAIAGRAKVWSGTIKMSPVTDLTRGDVQAVEVESAVQVRRSSRSLLSHESRRRRFIDERPFELDSHGVEVTSRSVVVIHKEHRRVNSERRQTAVLRSR